MSLFAIYSGDFIEVFVTKLDEKQRSSSAETDSKRTSIRARSLSVESSKDARASNNSSLADKLEVPKEDKNRSKPFRENSYLSAVRNTGKFVVPPS